MRKALILSLLCCAAGCVQYSLVPAGTQMIGDLRVTTSSDWNKAPSRPGPKATVWTKDGHELNEIIFIIGVEDGEEIFYQEDKELPLPAYKADMLPNEIAELVETSIKNSFGEGQISVNTTNLRPQAVGENTGFRFGIDYYNKDGLAKKGEVIAAPLDGQLNLIIFTAAKMHYYQDDLNEIESMFETLVISL